MDKKISISPFYWTMMPSSIDIYGLQAVFNLGSTVFLGSFFSQPQYVKILILTRLFDLNLLQICVVNILCFPLIFVYLTFFFLIFLFSFSHIFPPIDMC
jgi:hypothetical protein